MDAGIIKYAIIFVVLLRLFYSGFKRAETPILLVLLGVTTFFIVRELREVDLDNTDTFNKETYFQLQTIQSNVPREIDNLDDAQIIRFLYSILDFRNYNPSVFDRLVTRTDTIFRIKREMEHFHEENAKAGEYRHYPKIQNPFSVKSAEEKPQMYLFNTADMFGVSIDIRTAALNDLESLIFKCPLDVQDYLRDAVIRYAVLMDSVVIDIEKLYKESIEYNGVTSETRFIKFRGVKGFSGETVDTDKMLFY